MGRIIAGGARGTRLAAPDGRATRPTTDRVREALFNALAAWNGTLLVASHDRWLIDHWAGRRLALSP